MLISIQRSSLGRSSTDLLSVRISNLKERKGRKLTAHFKEVAKRLCGLLNYAIEGLEGRPSGGELGIVLSVSEGDPAEVQEMFDILSKKLDSMEILWDPMTHLRATVVGSAPLKGRGRL